MSVRNPPTFLQAGAHTAENTRSAFQGVFGSPVGSFAGGVGAVDPGHGVVRFGSTQLAVSQNGTPNMSVDVAAGSCFIRGTESATQGVYHCFSDATVNLTIGTANPTNARRDLIVMQVRDAGYSGADDDARLFVVAGTPSGSPADPTVPANCLVLARVTVGAGATTVVTANIADLRTYSRPWNTAWGFVVSGTDTASRTSVTDAANIAAGVAVTFTAPAGRRYKISGVVGAQQVTTAAAQVFSVYKGGSLLQKISEQAGVVGTMNTLHGFALDTPTAGSVTYSLRLATGAGTVNARGDLLTTRIIVEDIGPA